MALNKQSSKLIIRKYQASDYEACSSLWVELVQFHVDIYKTKFRRGSDLGVGFDEYLQNPNRKGTWVAEFNEQVIGLGGLLINGQEHADVEPMIVTERYRGKGVSRALMNRVVAAAKRTGVRFLSIQPGARNKQAFSAYVRLGFKKVWTIELIQELNPPRNGIKWLPGLKIHGDDLEY